MKDRDLGFDPGEVDASGYSVDDIISEVHARDGSAPKTAPRQDLAELLSKFGVSPDAHPAPAARAQEPIGTPVQTARPSEPARTPVQTARAPEPVRTPAPAARAPEPARTPAPAARPQEPIRTPAPAARAPEPVRTPAPAARAPEPIRTPVQTARAPEPTKAPAPAARAPEPIKAPAPAFTPPTGRNGRGGEKAGPEDIDIREFEPVLDEHDYPDAPEEDYDDEYDEEYDGEYDGEDGPSGGLFTRQVMLLLCSTLAALLLIGIAVVPDLLDPVWSILVIAGIAIECVPPVIWTAQYVRDRSRSLAPVMMLVSGALCALSAELVVLGVALAVFNVCFVFYDNFARRRLDGSLQRLEEMRDGMDPARDMRLENCIRELESGRVKSVVALRRTELLILVGAAALALVFALLPPLFDHMDFMKWTARASVVISVCLFSGDLGALMSVSNAVGSLFDNGVWIGGTGTVDAAADVTSVLFNKSGTLTDGEYKIAHIDPVRLSEDQLLYLAVYAGAYSEHPLNRTIRECAGITPDKSRIRRQRIEPGFGSLVQMEDDMIVGIGNIDFMEKLGVKGDLFVTGSTCVFVSVGRVCVGRIDFSDTIRPDAVTVVHDLKRVGVANVALMTGDNALCATNTGKRVGISEVYSDCRPSDKLERFQYILGTLDKGDRACFVTTAGSERELLEIANLSVTLGIGSDATANFPDAILPDGELSSLPRLLRTAREVRRNVTITFLVSSAARALTVILGIVGVMPLWLAVFFMCALMALGFMNSNVDA